MSEDQRTFELVITIVNRGYADSAMDAAKEAGATGGTLIKARGTGIKEAQKFFGIIIEPEKDVLLIVVDSSIKKDVMKAICKGAGLSTEGKGISFSLPVEEIVGIPSFEQ